MCIQTWSIFRVYSSIIPFVRIRYPLPEQTFGKAFSSILGSTTSVIPTRELNHAACVEGIRILSTPIYHITRYPRSKSVELGEGKGEEAGRWNVSRSRNWLSFDILQAWIKFCSFLTVQLFWNVRDIHHIDQNYCRFTVISVLATSSLKIFRVYCSIALFIKCYWSRRLNFCYLKERNVSIWWKFNIEKRYNCHFIYIII